MHGKFEINHKLRLEHESHGADKIQYIICEHNE